MTKKLTRKQRQAHRQYWEGYGTTQVHHCDDVLERLWEELAETSQWDRKYPIIKGRIVRVRAYRAACVAKSKAK